MAEVIPVLNDQDLALELKEYLSTDRAHFHFAFFGTRAGRTEVPVEGHGTYRVEPVRCELELRERFAELSEAPQVAWLVPFQGHVPHDLRHRFAKDGTVRNVGALSRIRRLFEVQTVEPGLDTGPLARWLLQSELPHSERLAVRAQRLTAAAMWSAWFASETALVGLSDLSVGQWLLRMAEHGGGPHFYGRLRESVLGERVLAAFEQHVERTLGRVGVIALRAWGSGRGPQLLQTAIVASALLDGGDRAQMWLTLKLEALGVHEPETVPLLRDAAEQALLELARVDGGRAQLAALLRASEDLVDKADVRDALVTHTWLPLGYRARLDQLGARLEEALASPSNERFQRAVEAETALAQHHHYADLGKDDADRARMAVRLLGFVLQAQSWKSDLPASDLEAMQRLAEWYRQEGGYVDLARQSLRTGQDTAFGRGVRKVLSEADALRRALDRRFAKGLAQWLVSGASPGRVQPIEHALGAMLKAVLAGQPARRALVLLMDGMGWAECIALLRSAAESADAFAPLQMNRAFTKAATIPEGSPHGLPTLASLPTITKVSRSAFFEGRLPVSGREPSSADDSARFARHPIVTELNQGRPARLLLRAESHEADGELSSQARVLIGDTNERVIALVVNAIDASLKSDTQQVHQWTLGAVRSLAAIFDEARRAGRVVLFASDHGHVRGGDTQKSALPERAVVGGERWRGAAAEEAHGVLRDDLPGAPLTLAGKAVWTPPGAQGLTVLTDERGRHTNQPHAGEHGGATLAEVVAPCLWLGPVADLLDTGLSTEALAVPDWWLLRPPFPATVHPRGSEPPTLPGVDMGVRAGKGGAPTRSRRPSQPALQPFALALSESALFKARAANPKLRASVVKAVSFMHEREGLVSLQDLADAVGEPFYRIAGFISQLQRVLNVDGEPILVRHAESTQVRLNLAALREQFEVRS